MEIPSNASINDRPTLRKTKVRTPRLLLRAAEKTDLNAFHEMFIDPEAMQFWSTPYHTSIQQTSDWLEKMTGDGYNGVLDFAVCLREDEETEGIDNPQVIGKAGVYDGKELGFIFNRRFWGNGYAYEAIQAVLQVFWTREDLLLPTDKVVADVDPRNVRSISLLEKLGFEKVGTAEKTYETHLGWCDSVYLEVTKPPNVALDWPRK